MSAVINGLLSTDLPQMHNLSPSPSNISNSSDDAPQLSFEYIFDDDGNAMRISKHGNSEEREKQPLFFASQQQEEVVSPRTRPIELLGSERAPENHPSISSVLSRSYGSLGGQSHTNSDGHPMHRTFQRAVSSSAAPMGLPRPTVPDNDRLLGRARRVPIDGKRKDDLESLKKEREEEEREKEARLRRLREKDKENDHCKDHQSSAPLSSSLIRTHSEPSAPPAIQVDLPDYQPHSQPLEGVQVHARSRRPLSKQQRVLGAVPRSKDSLGVRTSAGSSDARSTPGSIEGSRMNFFSTVSRPSVHSDMHIPAENDLRPIRPLTGGARRITKDDREKQEQEASEFQELLERDVPEHELQRITEEKEQGVQRELDEHHEALHEHYVRSQSSLSYFAKEEERHFPVVQEEREREPNKLSKSYLGYFRSRQLISSPLFLVRNVHQRRDSETVMPDALPIPARRSPSARHVAISLERNHALISQPLERSAAAPVERPQGLQRTSSVNQPPSQVQAVSRGLHRRSPTAPEPQNASNGNFVVAAPTAGGNAKGKTWAVGADIVGDVDRDLGGLGPYLDGPVREREGGKDARPPLPPAPIQIAGAKAFQVNGRTYGKLDMIGKGGSSRVYRVITPTNEIYALKRVSLDRTDQDTMQGYMNEIALLRRLDGNDRIIRLIESEVKGGSKGHLMLVMECGEVDLARLISARQSTPLDMIWVAYYWKQMLEAVHVIHEEKIVHSDLKPANFVLVKGDLKLIDFGIANAIANDTTNIQRDHQIGTVNYMSPESIEIAEGNTRLKVGRASDIWSLGCILYQMIYGFPPFHQLSVLQKMRVIPDPTTVIEYPAEAVPIIPQPRNPSVANGAASPPKKLYHLARVVPLEVIGTLKSCLMKAPKDRETIPQLLSAGWLHPKGRSGELGLKEDEVIIDRDLLRQVVMWAVGIGMTTGMPQDETLEDTLKQTLIQLQQCSRRQ